VLKNNRPKILAENFWPNIFWPKIPLAENSFGRISNLPIFAKISSQRIECSNDFTRSILFVPVVAEMTLALGILVDHSSVRSDKKMY